MKKLLFSIACAYGITLGVQAQIAPPEILFYKFNRNDEKVVNYASNPPAGTDTAHIMGNVTQVAGNKCIGALKSAGNTAMSNYLNTHWVTSLPQDFTISFITSGMNNTTTTFYVFGDVDYGQFRLFTNGVAGAGNWMLRGPLVDFIIPNAALVQSTMTTITYESSTQVLSAYVNGVLSNSVTTNIVPAVGSTFKVAGYGNYNGLPANALLEEFRFYSRALSAEDVLELYNGSQIDFLDDESYICTPGAEIVVKPNITFDNYNWSTGSTDDSIIVDSPGLFKLTALKDCVVYKDSVEVIEGFNYGPDLDVELCNFEFPYSSSFGIAYSAPGTYNVIIPNILGCDSMITLNLTENPNTIDTAISRTGTSLEEFSAVSGANSYQWYDCNTNTPIADETNPTFIATSNGSYSVLIENGTCSYMSPCFDVYTLSNQAYQIFDLNVYPNPSNGLFFIDIPKQFNSEFELNLYSITGQKIQTKNYATSSKIQVELQVENGLYFIELKDKLGNVARRQIIKN